MNVTALSEMTQRPVIFLLKLIQIQNMGDGTPHKEIELWNLLGKFGPPIYVKKSFKLREEGYITHVKVNIALLDYYLDLTSFECTSSGINLRKIIICVMKNEISSFAH